MVKKKVSSPDMYVKNIFHKGKNIVWFGCGSEQNSLLKNKGSEKTHCVHSNHFKLHNDSTWEEQLLCVGSHSVLSPDPI